LIFKNLTINLNNHLLLDFHLNSLTYLTCFQLPPIKTLFTFYSLLLNLLYLLNDLTPLIFVNAPPLFYSSFTLLPLLLLSVSYFRNILIPFIDSQTISIINNPLNLQKTSAQSFCIVTPLHPL
jgi:hypothetical protein